MKTTGFALLPEVDVESQGGRFIATSTEPWLAIAPHAALQPGEVVEITYRLSHWDQPVRPIFRFWTPGGGWSDEIGPAPVAGAAIWTGRIPAETARISVSPTNRLGRFDFQVEAIRNVTFAARLAGGLRRRPGVALRAVLSRLLGGARESDAYLDVATGFTPIGSYEAWRNARARRIDLEGVDAPRSDWTQSAEINLIVADDHHGAGDRACLIAALRAQPFPHWRLYLVSDREAGDLDADPRIHPLPRAEAVAVLRALPDDSLVGALAARDALYPYALGAIAEAAARAPAADVFYGDEDYRRADHTLAPVLKPGWSPLLQANRPYLGRAVFLRANMLANWPDEDVATFLDRAEAPPGVTAGLGPAQAHSLRRVLLTRAEPWPAPAATEPARVALPPGIPPSALIIIPTRDRAPELSRCLASLFAKTPYANFSVIIVDNGSVEPETRRLFETFRGDRIVSVLRCPGPFNHALLCNAAAARRRSDVLVFLSNDVEIESEDWLERLIASALLPDVGAVGGKLLTPDRRIQNAGVVLGMNDGWKNEAWRFGAGAPEGAAGWLSRNEAPHEVAAVSKACLAVARRKFMLAGGFDAEHLANAHDDLDLCLRLAERGWAARIDPGVRLIQARASSRGGAVVDAEADAAQRRWFRARWLRILRDDPFFHPGLSLYCRDEALS